MHKSRRPSPVPAQQRHLPPRSALLVGVPRRQRPDHPAPAGHVPVDRIGHARNDRRTDAHPRRDRRARRQVRGRRGLLDAVRPSVSVPTALGTNVGLLLGRRFLRLARRSLQLHRLSTRHATRHARDIERQLCFKRPSPIARPLSSWSFMRPTAGIGSAQPLAVTTAPRTLVIDRVAWVNGQEAVLESPNPNLIASRRAARDGVSAAGYVNERRGSALQR